MQLGTFRGHTVRRGLAFIMEGDYAGTPQGDVQYVRNIMGISQVSEDECIVRRHPNLTFSFDRPAKKRPIMMYCRLRVFI